MILVRVKSWLLLSVLSEVYFIMFFSSLILTELNWFGVASCGWHLSKIFCSQVGYSFSLVAFMFPWEKWFIRVWMVLFDIFFLKFQIIIGIYFWGEGSPRESFGFFDGTLSFGSWLFCLDFLMRGFFSISRGLLDILLSRLCTSLWTMVYCLLGIAWFLLWCWQKEDTGNAERLIEKHIFK